MPCNLEFYVRDQTNKSNFRLVSIHLKEKEIRKAVINVLKTCQISTEFVDKIPIKPEPTTTSFSSDSYNFTGVYKSNFRGDIDFSNLEDDPIFGAMFVKSHVDKARDSQRLKKWIETNHVIAKANADFNKPIREEVGRLQKELTEEWGILDIRWDCGWNISQFKVCLQGLKSLGDQYDITNTLKGIFINKKFILTANDFKIYFILLFSIILVIVNFIL